MLHHRMTKTSGIINGSLTRSRPKTLAYCEESGRLILRLMKSILTHVYISYIKDQHRA